MRAVTRFIGALAAGVVVTVGLAACTSSAVSDGVQETTTPTPIETDTLERTRWVWEGPPGADYQPHVLLFSENAVLEVDSGCNTLTFSWVRTSDVDIDIAYQGTTDIGCDTYFSIIESSLIELFPTAKTVVEAGDTLTLEFNDDTHYVYSPSVLTSP